jgi:xanthine dehydrogenase iron-sulfur cluster and FAD-binding subunit A
MNEELAELAASGAAALVSAMGTDVWQEAKRRMSDVLARVRGSRRDELSAALERQATVTRGTVDAGAEDYWTEALSQLLDRHPDLAPAVRALSSLPIPERPDTVIQVNSATGSGELYAVQYGTQHFASGPKSRDSEDQS